MKIWKKILPGLLAALLLLPTGVSAQGRPGEEEAQKQNSNTVSILFSHDMHSHMDTETITRNGRTTEKGGFAKTKTAIRQIKQRYPDSFIFDAGDFSMGTPYQTIFSSEASELRMMGQLQYDATTFGNHEFDYRATGLADMLRAASDSGQPVPALLSANIDWDKTLADPEKQENARELKKACSQYGVKDYEIIQRGGARVAVFGLLGKEADEFAPESGLFFKDPVETAKSVVKQIKDKEKADLIVCLSHSGTYENAEDSEDERLAEQVPDLDVIISGHTHTELAEPIIVGNTVIASCGSYTDNLGHLTLRQGDDGAYSLESYELIPLDENVKEDQTVLKQLEKFQRLADRQYFSQYGYKLGQVLAENKKAFTPIEDFAMEQREEPMGNLIADSYLYAVSQAEKQQGSQERVDVAIVPAGVVRASFGEGPVTAADAFNAMSLGYGKDGTPGYPLVSAYLTGKELKAVAEVDATISDLMQVARLSTAGMSYHYNPKRLFLNRATDVQVDLGGGKWEEVQDDKLYRVTADLYSCQMLGSVKEQSFGLLSIEPKDKNGQLIENYEDHILYDGERELKAWYALASYLDSFDNKQIPARYENVENRKLKIDSMHPAELLKQPNKMAALALGALLAAAALAAVIILLIGKRNRKKGKKQPG